jgi:hypothetical protein
MQRNNRLIVAVAPGVTLYSAPQKIENAYYMLTVSTAAPPSPRGAVVADPLSLVVRVDLVHYIRFCLFPLLPRLMVLLCLCRTATAVAPRSLSVMCCGVLHT